MMNSKGCCSGHCAVAWIIKILVIVGAINWGLVGVSMLMGNGDAWNVVHMLLGKWAMVEAIVYVLVGLAGIFKIFGCRCAKCMSCTCAPDAGAKM